MQMRACLCEQINATPVVICPSVTMKTAAKTQIDLNKATRRGLFNSLFNICLSFHGHISKKHLARHNSADSRMRGERIKRKVIPEQRYGW